MVLTVQFMSISAVTRSIDGGAFDACPILDRAPRMHCMADQRREKVRRQRSQARVMDAPICRQDMRFIKSSGFRGQASSGRQYKWSE